MRSGVCWKSEAAASRKSPTLWASTAAPYTGGCGRTTRRTVTWPSKSAASSRPLQRPYAPGAWPNRRGAQHSAARRVAGPRACGHHGVLRCIQIQVSGAIVRDFSPVFRTPRRRFGASGLPRRVAAALRFADRDNPLAEMRRPQEPRCKDATAPVPRRSAGPWRTSSRMFDPAQKAINRLSAQPGRDRGRHAACFLLVKCPPRA